MTYTTTTDETDTTSTETGPETITPPDLSDAGWGALGKYWRYQKYRKRLRKKIGEGYVRWFLVHDSWPEPKWVQPTDEGGGIPEVEHDGETYLFPRECMLPSNRQGAWTVVHKKGEAEPMNLLDPSDDAISAAALQQYKTMRPAAEPPDDGLFGFDLDPDALMKYALPAMIVLMLLYAVLGGAL